MRSKEYGTLTKEPPLATLDATIRAITPSMPYAGLLAHAKANTHRDAPSLLKRRFLRVSRSGVISYDYFLSLLATHPLESPFVRKVMYFLWAYRDERIRSFICERIADQSGRWRVPQLLNKANSKVFERWLQPSTARKARSNFEYFMIETKLYNPRSRTVHLEFDDAWLRHAAIAAAQHENNLLSREELLANPAAFLDRRGWLGLLNTNRANLPVLSPILSVDSLPAEDVTISMEPINLSSGRDWRPRSRASSGRKSTTVEIDLVTRERATNSHYMLEEVLVDLAKNQNLKPKCTQNIDIYFETTNGTVLVEIKSCTDSNFHTQVRKGISQLFEYRFLYRTLLGSKITMLLLMETAPPADKRWLVDYVHSLGVSLAWKDSHTRAIIATRPLSESLSKIITVAIQT
jgi:hypothetical protein